MKGGTVAEKKETKQPEGLPKKGKEGDWEGGLSAEPSLAPHYQDLGQTDVEDHTTKTTE